MKRIQRKRIKGYKMPENTLYIGRPSKWGNPFPVSENNNLEVSLKGYSEFLDFELAKYPHYLDELIWHDIACWCPLNQKCHGDIILEKISKLKPVAQCYFEGCTRIIYEGEKAWKFHMDIDLPVLWFCSEEHANQWEYLQFLPKLEKIDKGETF